MIRTKASDDPMPAGAFLEPLTRHGGYCAQMAFARWLGWRCRSQCGLGRISCLPNTAPAVLIDSRRALGSNSRVHRTRNTSDFARSMRTGFFVGLARTSSYSFAFD